MTTTHVETSPTSELAASDDATERAPTTPSAMPLETTPSETMPLETMPSETTDGESAATSPADQRRKIEEQLELLKRREVELKRQLALADHPTLADPLREIEGKLFAVQRAEARLHEGLSRSEEKKLETLTKKLEAQREKRRELDRVIGELEREVEVLAVEKKLALEADRRGALETLIATLGTQLPAFEAARLDVLTLVPDLAGRMDELESMAKTIVKS